MASKKGSSLGFPGAALGYPAKGGEIPEPVVQLGVEAGTRLAKLLGKYVMSMLAQTIKEKHPDFPVSMEELGSKVSNIITHPSKSFSRLINVFTKKKRNEGDGGFFPLALAAPFAAAAMSSFMGKGLYKDKHIAKLSKKHMHKLHGLLRGLKHHFDVHKMRGSNIGKKIEREFPNKLYMTKDFKKGGFLPLAAMLGRLALGPVIKAAAPKILGALATGALSGAAAHGVQKAMGKGGYINAAGHSVDKTTPSTKQLKWKVRSINDEAFDDEDVESSVDRIRSLQRFLESPGEYRHAIAIKRAAPTSTDVPPIFAALSKFMMP